jgi:HD-GYP domain-containing protein (c-di-GMP phosphodiesterase class II)
MSEKNSGFADRVVNTSSAILGGMGDGVAIAAQDAWAHKQDTLLQIGLSVGWGAALSLVQSRARYPLLAAQLGASVLGLNAVKHETNVSNFSSSGWNSSDEYERLRHSVANSVAPVAFDTALAFGSGMLGATLSRTVPVYMRERNMLNQLREYHAESAEHTIRVGQFSQLTAKQLGLSWSEQRQALHIGRMHDVGKQYTPLDILNKPTSLNDTEYAIMQWHAMDGRIRLEQIGYKGALKDVPIAVGQHHERIDGRGYPFGLVGDQMSPVARVTPVADVFDAITSFRNYATADRELSTRMPLNAVKALLDRGAGSQFDPKAVEAFWNIPANKVIAVMESSGRRPVLARSIANQFDGVPFGRVIEAMSNPHAPPKEVFLAKTLQSMYTAPDRI